jgi:hypothetical protein
MKSGLQDLQFSIAINGERCFKPALMAGSGLPQALVQTMPVLIDQTVFP